MSTIDKAIGELTEEMMKIQKKEPMAVPIEEHLTSVCTNEITAGRLLKSLSEGKTLKGSINAVVEVAKKKKSGNVAVLSDSEVYEIVDNYFDIGAVAQQPIKTAAAKIDVMDLL